MKKSKEKSKPERKAFRKTKYIIGMVILTAAAFLLPRFFFDMQDRGYRSEIGRGTRSGVNFAALAENYETSVRKRLSDFARGRRNGKAYYVAEVAAELTDEEKKAILQSSLTAQSGAGAFLHLSGHAGSDYYAYASNIWYYSYAKSVDVTAWKKYVVYDSEKVDFICWYADLLLDEECRMRVLLDAEDGSVYYMQGILDASARGQYDLSEAKTAAAVDKKSGEVKAPDKFVWNTEPISMLWLIAMVVYDADWQYSDLAEEYGTSGVNDVAARLEENNVKQGIDLADLLMQLSGDKIQAEDEKIFFPLDYGEDSLEVEIDYTQWNWSGPTDRERRISVGIREIAELIPGLGN